MAATEQLETGAAPLRVRLLGGFAVDGRDERAIGTRKARVLLKRLAVAGGRPVGADELADAVWGQELPANPADQVSVLVSRLRGVLGADRLPRSDAGYALRADWIDVVELEDRAAEVEERLRLGELGAALAAAHTALSLARGPLLPEDEAEWAEAARPAADRLLARARLVAAEAALVAGEVAAARAAAQAALDHDAYDEAALRLIMRADVAAGRPGAALAAYASMRERLAEDLGTDPAPETDRLHTAILKGELAAAAAAPAATAGLVGREVELQQLDAMLETARAGETVAAVVEAEAGLGKSALLTAWAGRAAASALVLSGRSDELGRDLPLQPVVDGLAAHLASLGREATAELLGADAATLAPLLGPAGSAGDGDAAPVTTIADAATGRASLFAALAATLQRAAGRRPLVLIVDDLHVAASGTAEFLAFVVRRLPLVMVLAARRPEPGPDLPTARRLPLHPLSVQDAASLVGTERAAALHERSGGNPLFLRELAAAGDGELPTSVVAAVRAQLARLGTAARTVEVAAVSGPDVDAELIVAATGRRVDEVLDDLEQATAIGLLIPRGAALGFRHELVRQAVESGMSPARRTAVHRAALTSLAARPQPGLLDLARHASLAGDAELAAESLTAAAARAAERYESAAAEGLLDEAIGLCDTAAARLARGRLRLARIDLDGARDDAQRAIEQAAGVQGFELAGWIAYYARDYDTALRYADEGVERAADSGLRASCLALGGRIRHTRGELAEATRRLKESVDIAPAAIRGTAQVWNAQLLAHRGETDAAIDMARRSLLDPYHGHPFAPMHGRFTLAYALALQGRWGEAFDAVDDLDAAIARAGDRRFPAVAANVRGWLLRGAGLVEAAEESHRAALELTPGPTFVEPRYAGIFDIAEDRLAIGDEAGAAAALAEGASVTSWTGSMFWKQRNRHRLLSDRLASAGGDHRGAAEDARSVATAAAERGDTRYHLRALVVAVAAEARAGDAVDPADLDALVRRFLPVSGPDGWRDLGELARATRLTHVYQLAEDQAARLVDAAAARADLTPAHDANPEAIRRAVRRQLDRHRPHR